MTDEEIQKLREMNAAGMCDWQIADALFYSKSYITLTRKKLGIPAAHKKGNRPRLDYAAMEEMICSTRMKNRMIAKRIKCSVETVQQRRRKLYQEGKIDSPYAKGRPKWEQVAELAAQGLTVKEICRQVRSYDTVVRAMAKEHNIKISYERPPRDKAAIEETRRRMAELYALGMNDSQIGKEIGMSPAYVWQWRKYYKLPNNNRRNLE